MDSGSSSPARRRAFSLIFVLFASASASACAGTPVPETPPPTVAALAIAAPDTVAFRPFADTLHGVVIPDPLRWMEDTLAPDVRAWLVTQTQYTDDVLAQLRGVDSMEAAITAVWQQLPTLDGVVPGGHAYFISRYLSDAPSLFVLDSAATVEREILGASALRDARNGARFRALVPSWNGRLVAVGTTERGDRNPGVSVLDASTGRLLADVIPDLLATTSGTRYEVTWLPDNSGFIYPRRWTDQSSTAERLSRGRQFLHRLGTPQSADVPVFGFGVVPSVPFEPTDLPTRVYTAPGSDWLVALAYRVRQNGNEYYAARLAVDGSGVRQWHRIAGIDDRISAVQLVGDTVFAMTRRGADRAAIVQRALSDSDSAQPWVTVIPEQSGVIVQYVRQRDALYFTERTQRDGVVLRRRSHGDTTVRTITITGGVGVMLARSAPDTDGATLSVQSWAMTPRWLRAPANSLGVEPLGIDDGSAAPPRVRVITERIEARSQDGTMVPVSLAYADVALKDGRLDGTAPLLIESYGAFGVVEDLGYRPDAEAWLAQGGVYAYAHVRGGGENGDAWHRAAMREHKQRTIDDMIGAIETLIAKRYTSAGRVVLTGTSNGAVIAGQVALQRPELIAAAFYEVGSPDEIRGAAFDPTAARNLNEVGDLDTPAGVRLLMAISPYHRVPERVSLPAMIVHSASEDYNFGTEMLAGKFAARLQKANGGSAPVLWVRTPGGHQSLMSLSPRWTAMALSFALWQTGVPGFQPGAPQDAGQIPEGAVPSP